MNTIEITGATGTPPYSVYVCDTTLTYCYVVTGSTTIPPTFIFDVPPPLDVVSSLIVKVIDANGCETFELYSCPPTPTPTPTNTPTPTITPSQTITSTPTPTITPTITPTSTDPPPTPTVTPTVSVTPTVTPTVTTTPTITPTVTPTPTVTTTQTVTPTPTLTPTPSPLPSLPGIYYGKFNNTTITSADTGSLTFVTTNDITNTYVTFPTGNGYGYVLIPITLPQPSDFKDSSTGCTGNDVPTNNIGTVVVLDANGFAITYNIYRTFYSFNGQLLCWLCS